MTTENSNQATPIDADIIEASFAAVAPQAERLVERFYEQLFDLHPAVKPMFAGSDMKSQRAKLLAALKLVVANVRNTDVLVPALQEMGRRHENYGARPEHYVAVASVLLSVMAEIAGDKWTEQINKAWTDALSLIAEVMIGAYSSAGNDVVAGPPEGVERRSADRPWSDAIVTADDDESQEPGIRKSAG